jgi:hypothetical protein
LMFANWPPLALFQVQTFGGIYSDELLIPMAPIVRQSAAARDRQPFGFDLTAA